LVVTNPVPLLHVGCMVVQYIPVRQNFTYSGIMYLLPSILMH